jgi:hypothetical protein
VTIQKARTPKVYVVTTPTGSRLVRAMSSQSAVKHAVLGTHSAKLASQDDLITALGKGLKVEDAGAEGDEA